VKEQEQIIVIRSLMRQFLTGFLKIV